MMNSATWDTAAMGYTTVEMLLEDVSKRIASSNLTRYCRGSSGQKPGGSMRVAKPNSANNSPRGSMALGRRRTVMNDGAYRRRVAMMEQNAVAAGGFVSNDGLQIPTQMTRPVSWHAASHLASQQQIYPSQFPITTPEMNPQYQYLDVSLPSATAYSAYTSPASAFSSISIPYNGYEEPIYQSQPTPYQSNTNYVDNQTPYFEQLTSTSSEQPSSGTTDSSMYSHFDWNDFATNGFQSSSTTPPTPENFLSNQHSEPVVSVEESIPYNTLSDSEDDGEELIGMGLYDAPESAKSSLDPQLDNYRSMMMSQLLGSNYRQPEPTGKGLKLEETWNPPASDDDEDDDDEQDGEGEDDDEPVVESHVPEITSQPVVPSQGYYLATSYQGNLVPQVYGQNSWL